jgi:putative spermidine/putrescine transport system substrate-binding protein
MSNLRFPNCFVTLCAASVLSFATAAAAEVTELRMIEAGGLSGDSIEAGYIKPFTAETGIKVVRENPSGLGKLRAMVEAGNVTAALLELGSPELEQAKALDLVEPLDWESIEPDPIFDEAKDDYGFGYQFYSTIMAWRTDAKPLTSLHDLWNVDEFPGKLPTVLAETTIAVRCRRGFCFRLWGFIRWHREMINIPWEVRRSKRRF